MFEATFDIHQRTPIEADMSPKKRKATEATFEIAVVPKKHNNLKGRYEDDCHPTGAITGLDDSLETLSDRITVEEESRQEADEVLQEQIDVIVASSDVTDIVGTYAQLQAYDTSSLLPNSIIKVLQDESQDYETTYYRWVINGGVGSWVLIGGEGPYYTKSQADSRFATAAQGAKADTALQPSALNGYATQAWVGQQGFLTSTALTGYATQQWVINQGYLTSSALNGYATEQWVEDKGYATEQYVDDIVGDIETLLYNINSGS